MSRLKLVPNIPLDKYDNCNVKWIHLKVCNEKHTHIQRQRKDAPNNVSGRVV